MTSRAQHAQIGNLHLETWIDQNRWCWKVLNSKTHEQLQAGEANDLPAAKEAAANAARVKVEPSEWTDIGPRI
jgi:hypothetical protein